MFIDPLLSDVVQLKKFEDTVKSFDHVNKFEIFASSGKEVIGCRRFEK